MCFPSVATFIGSIYPITVFWCVMCEYFLQRIFLEQDVYILTQQSMTQDGKTSIEKQKTNIPFYHLCSSQS